MNFGRRKYIVILVAVMICFFNRAAVALLFEPGIGGGFEYTDNVTLVNENKVNDVITTSYVGASLSGGEGALTYDANAAFNNQSYTQGSFADQRRFNLGASADWEMIKDRFNWFLSDDFGQSSVIALNANTVDNLQDRNVFTVGANARLPISSRQSFSLVPVFAQYYYEVLTTDNKQYSLTANWNYQIFRLMNIGLNLSSRKVDYTQDGVVPGRQLTKDTTYTNMAFVFSIQRSRSTLSANLGATKVKKDDGSETTGFAGYLSWLSDLSSRSSFESLISTNLTDSSRVAASVAGNDVQITRDVIRSSIVDLSYLRDDSSLKTRISARYNKLDYTNSPLDRVVRNFDVQLNYPMTQLLVIGGYVNFNRADQIDTNRRDKRLTVGGNLRYNFARELHGLVDLKYRTKESSVLLQNYDEATVFVSLVYGFGNVQRPTRTGGY